jgi:hypothetical protein
MLDPVTTDLLANPKLQFRIDAFLVPAEALTEFQSSMRRNRAFIADLPGFVDHLVFEKIGGPSCFDILTIAIWESAAAVAAASDSVQAYYRSIGFDPDATFARLGITAHLGFYRAPPALQ